ncbi:aconitase X [Nitrososphaera viennensis]|uniref:Phosphomevalonate dehydratase large subunit n=2 Tax=Nitrososphaera viennensis TaxID=1034015 RepID=A0A060HQS0_9ARCH|nr:aconitase X catalytic domain-containing protein [Nitrososphaera viennensis]AIC15512.1 putative aconitase subunit 1 [Nitrososphaera viennensis EN76]UVS70399.1 aconitase X catalytic domain-containing protein [Nitrososphaera viennensis]
MELTREEERALAGEKGEALALAYRILAAIGEATGAKRLVPVKWAHVSGVNYNTIGDAGVQFLEKFSRDARVAVKTTVNPMGYDRDRPEQLPEKFIEKQASIMRSYERMGVTPSFTCTPYEVFDIPEKGTAVSFAESNAAVFSNSLLGLRTNKESALSALASSVTGKAPLSDLRLDEARNPRVAIETGFSFESELDYGLLGYFAGKAVKDSSVALAGIGNSIGRPQAKALSAGIGTSGSCGMFSLGDSVAAGIGEKIAFGKEEARKVRDELSTADDGDIITLGSPQLGLEELATLARLTEGKKFDRRCMIFCSRAIHNQATKIGLTGQIEKAGGEFMCDSCTCLTPYVDKDRYDSVITSSVKAAYYMNNSNKVKVALKDVKAIVKEYTK